MKVTILSLLLLAARLFSGNAVNAQQSDKAIKPAPQPPPEMQSLTKAFTGEWSLNAKFEPDTMTPNGLVSTGEETWRHGPGGFTLLEEEHLRMPEGDLSLLGIIWWNTATKTLQGMECQNRLPYTCDVKGAQNDITMNWDGKQLVIDEMETSKTGKKSIWHEVWKEITPNSFTQTGEYGEPGAPRKLLFTIHATKVTASQAQNDTHGAANKDQPAYKEADPSPEVQSLAKALKGDWSTTYELAPGGISPTGGTGTGEEDWRISPGGYVLMEEEHVHTPSEEMYLIALHWWDKTTNSLRGMLCNNSGPAACNLDTYSNSTLKWNGKQLTIDMRFPEHGKKMLWHEVWSNITSTSFKQTGEMGEVGGALKLAVTIHATKIADWVNEHSLVPGPDAAGESSPTRLFPDSWIVVHGRFSDEIIGKGPDIVFIPGLTCSRATWKAEAQRLKDHYRLHLIQVAGFAGEPARANASGEILKPTAEAIDAYLAEQHLTPATIIGHSLGGTMVLYLAEAHPGDMKKGFIVDALPFYALARLGPEATVESARPIADEIRSGKLKRTEAQRAEFLAMMAVAQSDKNVIEGWGSASNKSAVANATADDLALDLRPGLANITIPLTLIYPDYTPIGNPPGGADALYRDAYAAVPNMKVVEAIKPLHFVMFDQPEQFDAALDVFLAN